jgi:hypothetical protein
MAEGGLREKQTSTNTFVPLGAWSNGRARATGLRIENSTDGDSNPKSVGSPVPGGV